MLALGIVREPTVWRFMEPKYSCTHDIGRLITRYHTSCRCTAWIVLGSGDPTIAIDDIFAGNAWCLSNMKTEEAFSRCIIAQIPSIP